METRSSVKDFDRLRKAVRPENEIGMEFTPETKAKYHFIGWIHTGILVLAIGFPFRWCIHDPN